MSVNNLPSISSKIDEESRKSPFRHSLQPKSHATPPANPVKRHHSLGKNRPTNYMKKPSVPDIPEVEKSDDESPNLGKQDVTATENENVRVSFTKKSRKTSNISRTSKTSIQSILNMERGFVNYGYDQQSTRSSLHGSMSSLPVIREQYCCCARWTKLEKNLALIVGILALIIIGLVIAIGLVAKHESGEPKRQFPYIMQF